MYNSLIKDKIDKKEPINIEIGCGTRKTKGFIGIDILPLEGVDIVADIEKGMSFIPDNSVDKITSSHVLEHLYNFELIIKEIHRVLKVGGVHEATVPHHKNPFYYSDYTHKRFFGLYSFDYFATESTKLKRKVPDFYNDVKFDIVERRLVFKSYKPVRYILKKPLNIIFNSNDYFKELYEEMYSSIFSCYELKFVMKK